MAKFRKKPIIIDAFQWHPEMGAVGGVEIDYDRESMRQKGSPFRGYFCIRTLEGPLRVTPGDWIIRDVKGELYSCKPDIFEATYEPADIPAETSH